LYCSTFFVLYSLEIMAKFFIATETGRYYQFSARATAYPDAILSGLSVVKEADLPANAQIEEHQTGERYQAFSILRMRLSLKNGKSVVRLASALAPLPSLIGVNAFSSTVTKVRPARQRVRV
jgi:hypothetical protein